MSKDSDGSPRRLRERMRRSITGLERRGGFEGLENVPPPTPSQVPVVVVDGVPVKPEIVPAKNNPLAPSDPPVAHPSESKEG